MDNSSSPGISETRDDVEHEDGKPKFAPAFASVAPSLHEHLKGLKGSDRDWPAVEARYRYGWQMANRPDFAEREWSDACSELRDDWQQRHPEVPWAEADAFVKQGWAAARGR